MRIKGTKDLEQFSQLIGEQNVAGCTKALEDNCSVWVFRSRKEVEADTELTGEEKLFCYKLFEKGDLWAGILRRPESKQPVHEPGITVAPYEDGGYYDTHGNYHGRGGSSRTGTH